ncbi:MAG TPA: carbohydrate ABC transporter permease [Acidimicrobiales bacterium]|nr:carbohydrate ABC transporter permease [Acidimicrobiales bacterium]
MELSNPRRVWRICSAVLIVLLFVIPIAYAVVISIEPPGQYVAHPLAPPTTIDLQNYSSAWQQGDLGPELFNTAIYAVLGAGVSTVLSLMIAFPVARRLVRWATPLYRFLVIGICIPLPIIPLFVEARDLHLYNNAAGYTILHVEPGLPLGVILLTAFVSTIPRELDEASWLFGCGYFRYLITVIGRLAWPSMVITFLYSLLGVWNDLISPVVLLANPSLYPVTQGVYSFYSSDQSAYTLLAAAVLIVSAPVVVLFLVSQRQLIRATMGGG